ncbi:mechanosensitive ion channel [Candidatus Dependentiae bacterium]|nr:mechanosensitive ion channel [Candidatus Dependentiae bacterium]
MHIKMLSFFLTLTISSLTITFNSFAINSFNFFNESEKSSVTFFSAIEQKKKLLEKLQEDQKARAKKFTESIASLREDVIKTDHQLETAKASLERARTEQEAALKNKKITILDEIRQVLISQQEELKEAGEIIDQHIKIIKDYLAIQTSLEKAARAAYSWQELREAQLQMAELVLQLESERKKKDDLNKQKISEADAIASLQKRLEVQSKEQTKILSPTERTNSGLLLKLSNELFGLETFVLQKKIELAKVKMNNLELALAAKNDALESLEIQVQNKKSVLLKIEKGLSLTSYDVETAKAEANLANHKAVRIKEAFNKKIDEKKALKKTYVEQRLSLQKKLKQFTDREKKSADNVSYHVLQSELHKVSNLIQVVDREIDFLTIKREFADLAVQNKEVLAHDVDVRYQLLQGKADAADLALTFKNQKDITLNHYKKMKDKHEEVMKSYAERSKALEDIKIIQLKINARHTSIFAGHETDFAQVQANLDESKKAVTASFSLSQEYTAVSTDYLARYEKILNQYNLIIDNLENHRTLFGLWKRSPNALSIDDLTKALNSGELFIKQLFFDAPKHLSISRLYQATSALTWQHARNIALLILLFISFMLLLRFLCALMIRLVRQKQLDKNTSDKGLLYATIASGALQFLKDHIISSSVWLFFFLHVSLDFKGIFALLRPYALPYYISLFYLSSIPLFIYLSRNLLLRLKELNKRISFLSFPENFQERLEVLITAYCYTLAILMPLKQAATHLLPHASLALTQLLSALQISILILIPVFIFNKEHILYFLPDSSNIALWIKKQIDLYYYPLISFFVLLFMLSRSFVGYGNLAAFLSFSAPLTVLVFYGMFWSHFYIRKYAVFLFIKETDEDITDKFEHARTYYGFFVIFSFLLLLLLSAFIIARIWEFNVTIKDFWRFLSETLVVPIGVDKKLGFVQLFTLILFIVGGFFSSSIIHRFVLNRLFDILRTEPGTQNTITKIVHYFTICLSILLGFVSIHLEQLIWYIGTTLAVGLGFALKDILADYVAGFFVLIERPIEIGNYVRLDHNPEMQGVVHKIDARTTTIMTRLNHSVIVANKDLVGKVLSNWGKGRFAVGFEIRIMVNYSSDIDDVKKTILEVLQSNPVILRVPNIIVRIDDFEVGGVYFLARAFISARRVQEQWTIAANLREEIFKSFKQKGIIFGFPQSTVLLGKATSGSPIQFNFEQ